MILYYGCTEIIQFREPFPVYNFFSNKSPLNEQKKKIFELYHLLLWPPKTEKRYSQFFVGSGKLCERIQNFFQF